MRISVEVPVHASKREVWDVITDIENAADRISGIDEIRILEQPAAGLVGLEWKEVRTLFGKSATEKIRITDAIDNEYYVTQARSHGCLYTGKVYVEGRGDVTQLGMEFEARPETTVAKLLSMTTGFLFKGATRKALQQDLEDIRAACEHGESAGAAAAIRS